jgi:hypothetical protein
MVTYAVSARVLGVSGLRDDGHSELAIVIGTSVSGPASPDASGKLSPGGPLGISGLRDGGHSERTSVRGEVGSQSGRGVDVGEHGLGSGIAIGVSGLRDGGHSDLGISGRVGSKSGPAVNPGEHGPGAGASGKLSPAGPLGVSGLRHGGPSELGIGVGPSASGPVGGGVETLASFSHSWGYCSVKTSSLQPCVL